jgi:hypothetical protein
MDTKFEDDEDDLPENMFRGSAPSIEPSLEAVLRPVAQAARSIWEREQKTDVISGLIMTLTNRAMKATARAGKLAGYNHKLQEEIQRQLAVQSRAASLIAWYEKTTQIVVGGQISSEAYDNGPHATGIRCDRCHRQVEEHDIVAHLLKHRDDDQREAEIKARADQMRWEREHPPVKPKRVRKKKEPAASA